MVVVGAVSCAVIVLVDKMKEIIFIRRIICVGPKIIHYKSLFMSNFTKGVLGGVSAFVFVALAFAGVSYWSGGVAEAAQNPQAQKAAQFENKKSGCGCAGKNLTDGTKKQGCSSGQCGAGNGTGCGCGGNRANFVDANGNGICDRAE